MYIAKIQVDDYKSFLSSPELTFTPGFNVIVGQNNAGKSALTEVLSLQFGDIPHRSMKTLPYPGLPVSGHSKIQVTFSLAKGEAISLLARQPNVFFVSCVTLIPTPHESALNAINEATLFQASYQSGRFASGSLYNLDKVSSLPQRLRFRPSQRDLTILADGIGPHNATPLYSDTLIWQIAKQIYRFQAERLKMSMSAFGSSDLLLPDASNLPEVLHNLQNRNPAGFQRLNRYVSTIFPEIRGITVPPSRNGQQFVEILIWSIDTSTERDDLAIPLGQSGTGIGQVLAILYVVLTATYPQTIIIDEPQSFLNPGAVWHFYVKIHSYIYQKYNAFLEGVMR